MGGGRRRGRIDAHALDRRAASRNRRLAIDAPPVREVGDQVHALRRGWQDEIIHAQQLGGKLDRRQAVGRDHVERRQQKISDRVLGVAAVESILERRGHLGCHAGQCQETVTDVSRRNDAVFFPQGSRTAPIVGGRHDRRDAVAPRQVTAQCREDNRKPGPAANGDNLHEASPLRRRGSARP
jgi:hypothetical protein